MQVVVFLTAFFFGEDFFGRNGVGIHPGFGHGGDSPFLRVSVGGGSFSVLFLGEVDWS